MKSLLALPLVLALYACAPPLGTGPRDSDAGFAQPFSPCSVLR
jgi:hypothetical protein